MEGRITSVRVRLASHIDVAGAIECHGRGPLGTSPEIRGPHHLQTWLYPQGSYRLTASLVYSIGASSHRPKVIGLSGLQARERMAEDDWIRGAADFLGCRCVAVIGGFAPFEPHRGGRPVWIGGAGQRN